jgi:hypothetical protein
LTRNRLLLAQLPVSSVGVSPELDCPPDYHSLELLCVAALSLTPALSAASQAFVDRFDNTFDLASKDYSPRQVAFAREITASLIGGIGYFHGNSLIDPAFAHEYDEADGQNQRDPEPRLTDERELFTATPSRPFFPRGFYWYLTRFVVRGGPPVF